MTFTKVMAVIGSFLLCCIGMGLMWAFAENNMSEQEVGGLMILSTTIAGGVYAILLYYIYEGD